MSSLVRVRLLKAVASPWGTERPGAELDVPAAVATVWVAAGVAVPLAAPEPEAAMVAPPENAMLPAPRPRKRGRR